MAGTSRRPLLTRTRLLVSVLVTLFVVFTVIRNLSFGSWLAP